MTVFCFPMFSFPASKASTRLIVSFGSGTNCAKCCTVVTYIRDHQSIPSHAGETALSAVCLWCLCRQYSVV